MDGLQARPVDPKRLADFEIPQVRQVFSARDAILYALSVGFGQDPLDERQLGYVYEGRDLQAVPSAAAVLGYPGFWMADPRAGVDPTSVLHGEQEIVLEGALPIGGEVIGRTHITGMIDKGA